MFPSLVVTGRYFPGVQGITGEQRASSKVYKGAETRAQVGHRSGGQVQLVHAAVFRCVMQRQVFL